MKFAANDHQEFFHDVAEDGFHIFSRQQAKVRDYHPNAFPAYPEFDISDIKERDRITIRAFISTSKTAKPTVESGHIARSQNFQYGIQLLVKRIIELRVLSRCLFAPTASNTKNRTARRPDRWSPRG